MDWLASLLLLVAILARTGTVPVVPNDHPQYNGFAYCWNGSAVVAFDRDVPADLLLHEYLHAYDCVDNGVMDGSPYPYPEHFKMSSDPGHLWVYWALANPEAAREIILRD